MLSRIIRQLLFLAVFTFLITPLHASEKTDLYEKTFHTAAGNIPGLSFTISGNPPNVHLTGSSGELQQSLTCTLCSVDEITTTAALLGFSLAAKINGRAPATLIVPPLSPEVFLFVDGLRIPSGLTDVPLPEGPHIITLSDGRDRLISEQSFPAGAASAISTTDFNVAPAVRPLYRAAIITGIMGAGLTAGGIALISLDGECGEVQDGVCQRDHDTFAAGVVMLSTGAAALATGISLAIIAAVKKRRFSRWIESAGAP